MKTIDKQQLEAEYSLLFCGKVQDLVLIRKNLGITQSRIAFLTSKSLATIQNFESFKCQDAFLLFAYKKILIKK